MSDIEVTSATPGQAGENVQSDPISSFSFDSIHEKAMNYGADTPVDAPASPEQVAAPEAVATPEPSATNVDNASAAQLAQLSDDQLVEVTVDGEQVQMPWKDAKAGVMRQAHYTRNMQALRQEQATFEQNRASLTQAQQEREALVSLLKSEDLMKQFLQKQYPHLLQQAQAAAAAQTGIDPDDIATVGQLQQQQEAAQAYIAQMQAAMQAQMQEQLAQVTQTIEDRAVVAKLSESINGTIGSIFKEHPYLQEVIPNAEQVLRYEVLKLQPSTPEETLAAFKQVAEGWVETFNRQVEARNKSAVIAKSKLTSNNIQPPGGAQVQPTPTNFKKVNPMTGKTEVDWDALRNAALNYSK
jgi:hypothetical protein